MGLAGCGTNPSEDPSPSERDGLVLQLVGGTWSDGSGRLGLALLATFRDEQGRGPVEAWSGSLADSQGSLGRSFRYESSGEPGSHAVWWWSDVGFAAGETYRLTLSRAEGVEVVASVQASDSQGLPVPEVELSPDGTRLTWGPVPGAASYGCQVYAGGSLQLSTFGSATECDVSALPGGTYAATVLAFSASLESLSADASQRPPLPEAFHVSEGRLAFAKGQDPGATLMASAAGG
ncbi:MAG TPA: hypothetical protein VLQ93_18000, partial [Myxococcaceae bacterium]|nr:hypothetical protein [Myxococcaceae bacterium]